MTGSNTPNTPAGAASSVPAVSEAESPVPASSDRDHAVGARRHPWPGLPHETSADLSPTRHRYQHGLSDLIAFMINHYNSEALSALPDAPVIDDGYREPRTRRPVRGSLAASLNAAASAACRWADRLDPDRGSARPT